MVRASNNDFYSRNGSHQMNRSPNAETSYAWNTQKLKVYVPGGLSIMNLYTNDEPDSRRVLKCLWNEGGYQLLRSPRSLRQKLPKDKTDIV